MKKIKIAAIVGSLRKASLNRQLAEAAAALCGMSLYLNYSIIRIYLL